MKIINKLDKQAIADLITKVESNTDAEFVAVLAKQSDDYRYIPLLWAALVALLLPAVLLVSPFWLTTVEIFLMQWAVFFVAILIFRIPSLRIHLIPKSVRFRRASNLARRQFLENNLHHTQGETGVLLFVSEAEHYVEIIADRGINNQVEQKEWQAIIDAFVAAIKSGNTQKGFIECITRCGEILTRHVPSTHEKDELPNHLIEL